MADHEPNDIDELDNDEIDNADELSVGFRNDGVLDASDTLEGPPGAAGAEEAAIHVTDEDDEPDS
jgi:hypothetical protein